MIGKIRKGASFTGLARYLYGPGKREEHVDPRVVAGEHVSLAEPRAWRDWAADMTFYAGQRPDVARPVWHCSLRAAPEDPVLDDARWAAIATGHIEAMGLSAHPWVAVRHGEDHVHIVACRVDPAGRVWRDSHDYARSRRSCRRIEVDHGLTVVDGQRRTGRYATTTASERARAERQGREPERVRLRDAMHTARAAAAGAGVAGWERELDARGVLYRAVSTRAGTIIGYRVSLPGWCDPAGGQVWLKASQVDRALSWARIRPDLDGSTSGRPPAADPEPGRRLTAAQLAAQAFPPLPRPGRAPAGTPGPSRGPARLATLDRPAPRRASPAAIPLHALSRLVAVLRAGNRNEAAAMLNLLYALARLGQGLAELREAHDRLHHARTARAIRAAASAPGTEPRHGPPVPPPRRGR